MAQPSRRRPEGSADSPEPQNPAVDASAETARRPRRRPQAEPAAPVALAHEPGVDFELPFSPACCCVDAFRLVAAQMQPLPGSSRKQRRLDTEEGLLAASVAVAMHALPQTHVADVDAQIQKLADAVREGLSEEASPQAIMAHLHQVLFDDYGFCGNSTDYYNPRNSYLPGVLKTRRGLPIAMAMIYKLVAGRLGLRAWGVGLPGHFVAGVDCHGPVLVDCFHGGRLIDRNDAQKLVEETAGPEAEFDDTMLRPVTHRHWVTRLIQNLLQIHSSAGSYNDVAAMLELELVLWPDQLHLQRDLGLVLARIGQPRPAARWLKGYLEQRPDDPQRSDLEELLSVLR